MKKWVLVLAVCFIAGCQTAATPLTFNEALSRAKAQPADMRQAYETRWADFNNANHIDDNGGCYYLSTGSLQQVLVIDKTGVVTDVIADVDNAKSRCFRQSYLHVQFPAPPLAPYYLYLNMQ